MASQKVCSCSSGMLCAVSDGGICPIDLEAFVLARELLDETEVVKCGGDVEEFSVEAEFFEIDHSAASGSTENPVPCGPHFRTGEQMAERLRCSSVPRSAQESKRQYDQKQSERGLDEIGAISPPSIMESLPIAQDSTPCGLRVTGDLHHRYGTQVIQRPH